MYVEQLYTDCLAEAAYYIESNGEAAVVDPLRDIQEYVDMAEKRGAKLKYIFETHFHADFVSGHIDLAKRTGATIVFGPEAHPKYDVHKGKDGEVLPLGNVNIKIVHTPGHTPESTCFLLQNEEGKDYALFTGDTLFVNEVGRPDLLEGVIMDKEELATMLYNSLNTKIKTLADDVIVYPGHGPGSACGKNIGKETFSTIGEQKRNNYALQEMPLEEFIEKVAGDLPKAPGYFLTDAMANRNGYEDIDEVIKRNNKMISVAEAKEAVANGAVILDTRHEDKFEKGFAKGAYNIGLEGTYASWIGILIKPDTPLVLFVEEGKGEEAVTRLARIAFENVVGIVEGGVDAWKAAGEPVDTVTSISAEEFVSRYNKEGGLKVMDVRKAGEYGVAHVKGAEHFCLSTFVDSATFDKVDKNETYYVHCAGGYRSMIASAVLKRNGVDNFVNVHGGFKALQEANATVEVVEEVA